MRTILEEVDGQFYSDIIISIDELKSLTRNEMVQGEVIYKRRKCYVGIRLQGVWDQDLEDDYAIEER